MAKIIIPGRKKTIAVIIGSVSTSKEDILECRDFLERFFYYDEIRDPITDRESDDTFDLLKEQRKYVEYIANASHIIVVKKPDGTVEESTSYEMAMADFFHKPVIEWKKPNINLCNGGIVGW